MRQNTRLRSIIHSACALSLVAGYAIGLYGTAFILSANIVYAASAGGGGSGGAGSGSGGAGSSNGGAGAGSGGAGTGAGGGTGGSGAGTGAGTGTGGSGTGAGAGAGTGGSGAGTGAGTGTGGSGAGTGAGSGTGGSSAGAGAGRGTGGGSTGTSGGSGSGVGLGGAGIGSGTGAGNTGRGAGSGGTGAGSAAGAAGGSAATGTGSSGIGPGSTGAAGTSGAGDTRDTADERGNRGLAGSAESGGGFFARLLRGLGLGGAEPSTRAAAGPPLPLVRTPSANAPHSGQAMPRLASPAVAPRLASPAVAPRLASPAVAPAPPREAQAFRFEIGTSVFPTTGGVLTTEGVDGVDLVTVDAMHHRVIRPAAFFEPHEGAQYDRRAVERFWPIELGKEVRFIETVGNDRWLHVMSATRLERVAVPAGVFRAFVVERTVQSIGEGPRPRATYTYWYAPDAGAIVKTEIRSGDGKPAITQEADVLGYPLLRSSTASGGALP